MAKTVLALGGLLIIFIVLWDAFRTVILPRRVTSRFRLIWLFNRLLWPVWAEGIERVVGNGNAEHRDGLLGIYGPVALLFHVILWAIGLIVGFGMMQWALGPTLVDAEGLADWRSTLYFSGVTFFTLGYGDVRPTTFPSRLMAVAEAGVGYAFLAVVIGYLPLLYQSFSRREVMITLLDARAGSPPSAGELLRRCETPSDLPEFLADCEKWAAELLESHLSYPVLGLFRSQHEHQSWLAALTAMLDTCALVLALVERGPRRQAQLTFAMARHVAVDLAQVYDVQPRIPSSTRLPSGRYRDLYEVLAAAEIPLRDGQAAEAQLTELREMYEPYVCALAIYLRTPLPPWFPGVTIPDAWESSPYDDLHWRYTER